MNSAGFNHDSVLNPAESLSRRWQELCRQYLPVIPKDTIWRYNRLSQSQDPDQGWKLHISATILTAVKVLEIVAPFLEEQKAYYKAPISLQELKKINSGIYYDYSQIGKFITIYPQDGAQAVYFAEKLHWLTFQIPAPTVPYDLKFNLESCVHYRYGAFKINKIKNSDGTSILTMRDPQGNLIPDLRDSAPYPAWVSNPFSHQPETAVADDSPLKKDFRVFQALTQRGKGGVYQGVDFRFSPRFCLIKEGRKHGEVEWDGRDGYWRIQNEKHVLGILRAAGIKVPQIYHSFETGKNYYLVTEFIEGESLHSFLAKRKSLLSIPQALKYAIEISGILAKIHAAGWIWRDCKPANLIVTKSGKLRPIDFEGACPITQPDPVFWSTQLFKSLDWYEKNFWQLGTVADLFALSAIIYLLFEGEIPTFTENSTLKMSRRNVPAEIKQLVAQLSCFNTSKHFKAQMVTEKLKTVQKSLKNSRAKI